MKPTITIRNATREDVPAIVHLFADDILGSKRETLEDVIPQSYYDAFEAISQDANQQLIVASMQGVIVGTLQLTILANMSFKGAKRALLEGVHVAHQHRNQGIGQMMMEWAIAEAKKNGCRFVQLTSNKQRKDAHRFYERLGFVASHEGFKMELGKYAGL